MKYVVLSIVGFTAGYFIASFVPWDMIFDFVNNYFNAVFELGNMLGDWTGLPGWFWSLGILIWSYDFIVKHSKSE